MRKIPVYDTSSLESIKQYVAEWDDYSLNSSNYDHYSECICRSSNCLRENHLEVSRSSPERIGRMLRTASLVMKKGDFSYYAESLYQGSKVFQKSGHGHWMYDKPGNFSLKEKSKFKQRKVVGIDFFGYRFPTEALSDLHDILYWTGLEFSFPVKEKVFPSFSLKGIDFFTDCFDSPGKNSQSKSLSLYYWRWKRGESVWDFLTDFQKKMVEIIKNDFEKENKIENLFFP